MYKLTYRVANPLFIIAFLLFAAAASVPFANIPGISEYVSLGSMTYFYAIPLWQLGAGLAVAAILPVLIIRGGLVQRLAAGASCLCFLLLFGALGNMAMASAKLHPQVMPDATILINWVQLIIVFLGGLASTLTLCRSERVLADERSVVGRPAASPAENRATATADARGAAPVVAKATPVVEPTPAAKTVESPKPAQTETPPAPVKQAPLQQPAPSGLKAGLEQTETASGQSQSFRHRPTWFARQARS